MQISNNKILITGGASGIGFGLAERFIAEGNQVIICGRRQDALEEAAKKLPSVIIKQCDLEDENQRIALYDWVAKEHGDLNVLVNNAGIQNWMNIEDSDFFSKAKKEIKINVEAPIQLITLFQGLNSLNTVINVTSGLAFSPLTTVPVYCATKAFFHSFTLSLRYLLSNTPIEVIEIIPPALNTDLGGKGLHDMWEPVSAFIESVFKQLEEGKQSISHGFSVKMSEAGQETLQGIFNQMNPKS
ncbi:SDR family oxidoreductase [Pedobacter sp. BMA]|uniref:SDR family oxidoreductase n=1 Tax=Pedobacter sp. BMA TaxID=1663685 RepID=UPI00064A3D8B|nr:SDR family NAD(P)-dependent oxidoreductase [Pedobacter sp. BMA]KLT67057.1 cytochrome C553 [Pedobacter sp. BMA]